MARLLAAVAAGLLAGALLCWWWLGNRPRSLAQPSDRLVAWAEVASVERVNVAAGGTTWIVTCRVHLRNIGGGAISVNVPPQRFLLALGDGSTITGRLGEATTARIIEQQTASIDLPKVSFFSRSQDASSVILGIDEGDGLRLVAAPVGEAPPPPPPPAQPEAPKPP